MTLHTKNEKLSMNYFKQDIARRIANYFGYEIIPLWRLDDFPLYTLLHDIFFAHSVNYVIDVGANTGQYAHFLRDRVRYQGHIISFEPIKANVEILRAASKKDSLWQICDCALGGSESRKILNIMNSNDFSSFLSPDNSQTPAFNVKNSVQRTEQVSVRSLDAVLNDLKINPSENAIYLKLDTQGYDLEVIAGSAATLPYIRAIQTEVSSIPIYKEMPDLHESIEYISKLGFKLAGFYPVSRKKDFSVIEFDAIFINSRFEK